MAPSHHQTSYAPSLEKYLNDSEELRFEASVEAAIALLKRRQVRGPEPCALITAHVLSQVVAKAKWTDADQLLDRVYQVGLKLVDAQPKELVIGNILRRVLGLIRDEATEDRNETNLNTTTNTPPPGTTSASDTPTETRPPLNPSISFSAPPRSMTRQGSLVHTSQSMYNLLSAVEPAAATSSLSASADVSTAGSGTSTPVHGVSAAALLGGGDVSSLRSEIIDGIDEIKDEIGQADDQIAGFAEAQIRPTDYVMVYAPSRAVEKFLIKAASRRRYTLLLVGGNGNDGSKDQHALLLKRLAAAKVHVIQVASSAVSPYMSKVNRVIVEARAVAPDGGVMVDSGGLRLARAARAQGRTVVIIGGVYRVSPEWWYDPEDLVEWGTPANLVPFADGAMMDGVNIETALTEYIPPALIDIYVTNLGPIPRAYLDTIIADHYKKDDMELYAH